MFLCGTSQVGLAVFLITGSILKANKFHKTLFLTCTDLEDGSSLLGLKGQTVYSSIASIEPCQHKLVKISTYCVIVKAILPYVFC